MEQDRVRVKICGITRIEDGLAAARLGVDAVGLVFYPRSSRLVDVDQAARISAALPAFVSAVGLFLDADAEQVREVLRRVPLDILQFHGAESPDFCQAFEKPFIKAVPMREAANADSVIAYGRAFVQAKALLLDSHGDGVIGGSGETFDWQRIPTLDKRTRPIILAGGLNPTNVAAAVNQVSPFAVDVSSGVESAKGIKDATLIRAFMQNLKNR